MYFIGGPGSGKSSCLRGLLSGLDGVFHAKPFGHVVYAEPNITMLGGWSKPDYPGTDMLSFAVQPEVEKWIASNDVHGYVVGEGDRLTSERFFNLVKALRIPLVIVYLECPVELSMTRRSGMKHSFIKGRFTKCGKIARAFPDDVVCISTVGRTVEEVLAEVRAALLERGHPL